MVIKPWDQMVTVKHDILAVFRGSHGYGQFEKSLNATFIVLIRTLKFYQNSEAMEEKDFSLISLMGGVHKLIAKVLT